MDINYFQIVGWDVSRHIVGMTKKQSHSKRSRDVNIWAKQMVELATMDSAERAALQRKLAKKKRLKRHIPAKRGSGC